MQQTLIVLSAAADRSQAVLKVRDTGSGIDPADVPFIFDRFYRADKSRQRAGSEASGLGLAITKAIVTAHGGSIAVESKLGIGTTFTITLPAVSSCDSADSSGVRSIARAAAS